MGPAPFCAMLMSDLGATVVRVDRASDVRSDWPRPDGLDVSTRGRHSIALDLKRDEGRAVLLDLIDRADVLIEGFRPGVAERLGFGPEVCRERNPGLVYGRMSGYGQDGPLAAAAGHDINYLAIAGVLGAFGPHDRPPSPPLNVIGDFGGGGMLLTVGVLAALHERARSGLGQVIDCSMVEASALLFSHLSGARQAGDEGGPRGTNQLDGGAPYYQVYETADGAMVAFGAIEPQFYAQMLDGLGLDPADLPGQTDRSQWPALRQRIAAVVHERSRAEWVEIFAGRDACFTPVVEPERAIDHPHNAARRSFVRSGGLVQPAPAPRFSRGEGRIGPTTSCHPGEHSDEVVTAWGVDTARASLARASGALRQA
jgi:alpha-methylacyl-CoA racemase